MAPARIASASESPTPAERSTQVLSLRNPSAGSTWVRRNGNDRETELARLPIERQVPLSLLPGTKSLGTDENCDGAAGSERLFQR
jgi:hypothetical protein